MVRIRETAVIDAPLDVVWRILREFNSHHEWHPAIAHSRIEGGLSGDEVGAVRAFSLKEGGFLREQLLVLDDRKHVLSYCLLEAPMPLFGYVAKIQLKPVTDGGQTFWIWESRFDTPPERQDELARLVAQGIYRAGMRALEARLVNRGAAPRGEVHQVDRDARKTLPWQPAPVAAPAVSTSLAEGRTMAIVMERHGGPEVLKPVEIEVPRPRDGEVQIRQTAIGVNFIDIYCRTGYFDLVRPPGVPGMEAAGVVTDIGPGVTHLRVGQAVAYACAPPGAYAGLRTMSAELVIGLPAGMPDQLAAAGLLKGVTAAFLLHDVYPVKPGDTAVIHAAAGGVGSLLTQWAASLGANVIATVSNHEKASRARELGAHEVIIGRGPEFVDAVMDLTGSRGAEVIYDAIGADSFDHSIAALALRGHLASYGQASGPIGARDIGALASRSVTLSRPNYGHYTGTRALIELQSGRLFAAIAEGRLRIEAPTVFKLAQAADAQHELESGRTTGALIMVP